MANVGGQGHRLGRNGGLGQNLAGLGVEDRDPTAGAAAQQVAVGGQLSVIIDLNRRQRMIKKVKEILKRDRI